MMSMRKAYGEALVRLGSTRPEVVVVGADVSNSDYSNLFERAFPERFFSVGIAEQCLVDVAAGLAYSGMIPFANTFAFLFATRALEMVRSHLCYGGANVKLMGAYAGLSDSFDGPTHHAITDLAVMRSLPNMTVVVPADAQAVVKLLPQVADWPGPVYFRLNRNEVPVLFDDRYSPEIGKAVRLRDGGDAALIACGLMVSRALAAADELQQAGIQVQVLEVHTLKPLDSQAIVRAARETGALVTIEEHSILGGLGGAVAEVVAEEHPVPLRRVGLRDCFAESGPYEALLDRYGMSVTAVVEAVHAAVAAKSVVEQGRPTAMTALAGGA
jgi:transketolase